MRRILGVVAALAVIIGVVPASASTNVKQHVSPRVEDDSVAVDVRADDLRAPRAEATAAARDLGRSVKDLHVTWNGRTATAKYVFSDSGFLSQPIAAPAERIARSWLSDHRALFGLGADAVEHLIVTRDAKLPRSGLDPLVFRVVYGDIHTFAG